MSDQIKISEFLQKSPLYQKVEIDQKYFHPCTYEDLTFQFYCPNEKTIQTFKLILEPQTFVESAANRLVGHEYINQLDPYKADKSIEFTHYFSGECQFCKSYKSHFLLNVFSDRPMPGLSVLNRLSFGGQEEIEGKIYIRKIGQFPAYDISPDKEVYSFLNTDDKDFYKKALICISQSFGIAAYAYLRRITENEILRVVEALSELELPESENIKKLYQNYKTNHQMSTLVEGVYQHLPESIKSLGINPLKVLHGHLSEGIHSDDEETCLKKAFAIDALLKFTIKKLNEEKTENKEIRNVLKSLGH
jgi:hypothetical protein